MFSSSIKILFRTRIKLKIILSRIVRVMSTLRALTIILLSLTKKATSIAIVERTPSCASSVNVHRKVITSCDVPYPIKDIECISMRPSCGSKKISLVYTEGAGENLDAPPMKNFAYGFSDSKRILIVETTGNLTSRTDMFEATI